MEGEACSIVCGTFTEELDFLKFNSEMDETHTHTHTPRAAFIKDAIY